jgi:hypothetical protein
MIFLPCSCWFCPLRGVNDNRARKDVEDTLEISRTRLSDARNMLLLNSDLESHCKDAENEREKLELPILANFRLA